MSHKVTFSKHLSVDEAFHSLVMGVFIHNPCFQMEKLGNLSEINIYSRYGDAFQSGLTTFGRLSPAEQVYLIQHLQK